MKVLVCGSRKWTNLKAIERELEKLPASTIIIHGACRGADNTAGFVAWLLGFEVRTYPAAWEQFGRRAGSIRNQVMLNVEHQNSEPIDKVLAFHEDPGLGKGTWDMVARAKKAGIPVEVFAA